MHMCVHYYITGYGSTLYIGIVFLFYYYVRWDVLNVAAGYATASLYSDTEVMLAAGYMEGALTQQ